jgi:tetratricopeptide (TPR) repeat protein
MPHRETSDAERIEQVILNAVRHILQDQDAASFLSWAKENIPMALGLVEAGLEPDEQRRLAILLATAIWNATPLPAEKYRPRALSEPAADTDCPCGSGLEYAACCAHIGRVSDLPSDLIWGVLLGELSERQLQEAIAERALPSHMLGSVAARWLDEDRPGRAASLLEPIFDGEKGDLDERFDVALNVLCDTYDRLDHYKKKREFLERMTRSGTSAIRAVAWQRLSTIHIDEGDFAQAEAAFTQALRHDPGSPGVAILEITLLAAQHKETLARQRADFWRRKLVRMGEQDEELMAFFSRASEDPQDALVANQAAGIDPLLLRLREWLQATSSRALPSYRLELPSSLGQPAVPAQLSISGAEAAPEGRAALPRVSARLRPPAKVRRLEVEWHRTFRGLKPYSIQLVPTQEQDVWEADGWLRFLVRHPEAADSLDVLDDIATALFVHPESSLPWIARAIALPLLERAQGILAQVLPGRDGPVIPWGLKENRAALRLLFRLYLLQDESGDAVGAAATLETLLRLNPDDNHGVRAELMNHYLRQREDERALELASRFPNDLLADLAYGEVLALYRLGQQADAERALTSAVGRLPRIPHYLTRKRVRQPTLRTSSVKPGDDDQAWLYREAMRDVWESEPGILTWMKKVAACRESRA